eukprot:1638367-Karenia_brevis.AAC.1
MPFSGQTAPLACVYEAQHGPASVDAWLAGVQRSVLEVTLPSSADEHDLAGIVVDDSGGSKVCSIHSIEVGLALRWNNEHPEQRLRKGDQPLAVNGQSFESKTALLALNSSASTRPVLTFKCSCPNEEQCTVLVHVAARVKLEWFEERAGMIESCNDDPRFELVHGLPGTGKSMVIAWIRE